MTDPIDSARRELMSSAATFALMSAIPSDLHAASVPHAESSRSPAFRGSTVMKPLPFDARRLKGLSERLITSHWENNYGGAVKALAALKPMLADAMANPDMPPFVYNALKREHLLRTGSVVLHELYFGNLGGGGHADSALRTSIADAFGSFDAWEAEFRRIGAGLGGGSGWVVLGYNPQGGMLENFWMADHAHGAVSSMPLLVMDMYEHSYQMDYGAEAARYIDAFFDNIRWEVVARRLAAVQRDTGVKGLG